MGGVSRYLTFISAFIYLPMITEATLSQSDDNSGYFSNYDRPSQEHLNYRTLHTIPMHSQSTGVLERNLAPMDEPKKGPAADPESEISAKTKALNVHPLPSSIREYAQLVGEFLRKDFLIPEVLNRFVELEEEVGVALRECDNADFDDDGIVRWDKRNKRRVLQAIMDELFDIMRTADPGDFYVMMGNAMNSKTEFIKKLGAILDKKIAYERRVKDEERKKVASLVQLKSRDARKNEMYKFGKGIGDSGIGKCHAKWKNENFQKFPYTFKKISVQKIKVSVVIIDVDEDTNLERIQLIITVINSKKAAHEEPVRDGVVNKLIRDDSIVCYDQNITLYKGINKFLCREPLWGTFITVSQINSKNKLESIKDILFE